MVTQTWADLLAHTQKMNATELTAPVCVSIPGGEIIPLLSLLRLPVERPVCDREGMPLGNMPAGTPFLSTVATCRHCGCTQDDCSQCIARTGSPCSWVSGDECSACVEK